MDLPIRLEKEAAVAGGLVHALLGHYEAMNLPGDLRYVSPSEYAALAEEEPADARAAAYERFAAERSETPAAEIEAEAPERYPPGYFGHRRAFGPEGTYGSWLLRRPAIVVINRTAFAHGGLSELVARSGMAVNDDLRRTLERYLTLRARLADAGVLPAYDMQNDLRITRDLLERSEDDVSPQRRELLEEFAALAEAPVLGLQGPLWYRGSVYCSELVERPVLDAALGAVGASSVVVGHTPSGDRRVRALHDGRVVMLDTGMLAEYYSGRPAALVIEEDERRVLYLAPRHEAAVEHGAVLAHGRTEPELLALLAEGELEPADAGASSAVRVTADGTTVEATLYGPGEEAERELAAFALDRLLGLGLVPPTAERELEGEPAALQLRYPDSVTENERLEQRLPFGWCPIEPQVQLMQAFDLLSFNTSRTRETLRYRNDLTNLVLVGHTSAFGARRTLPRSSVRDNLDLPGPLVEALEALDEPVLEEHLGEWLSRRQLSALLARREVLLENR
jgi:hypothetical protein